MASDVDFQGLVLNGIINLDRKEVGRGAYGRVYGIKYCGTICAAKEIHSILVEEVGDVEVRRTVEAFMRECRQCSTLRHPNVIQFLGVYYPLGAGGVQGRMRLPVMVMEMMADSLASLVDKYEKIPTCIKFSIVHDVSLGLCYLHNHDPPIIHRDLSPNNVLLTAHHVAKISDLGVAKVIKADSRKTMTKAPGTVDFMPPESLDETPVYGPPLDVFSFAGIVIHTFNQQWPHPSKQVQFDPITRNRVALSEVQRRQQYLDKMIGEAEVLRPLVEECLDDDPAVRPTITAVCERIQVSKDVYTKQSPKNFITLYQQVEQQKTEIDLLRHESEQKERELIGINELLRSENIQLKSGNDLLQSEIQYLRRQLSSYTRSVPPCVDSELNRGEKQKTLKWIKEAPPLMPALATGRYHIKWTQLANLPAPTFNTYVTVQDKKVYVAGGSGSIDDVKYRTHVYDLDTDHWDQLPPSGHWGGVPHIIGGKLVIIGGRLSATNQRTNKVSTFDETSQTWVSYYPDLLSIRNRPGVVTHLEHVIVAGGGKDSDSVSVVQDDIEILNWIENSHWRKVSINLPVPMGNFSPTITGDHLLIVGYTDGENKGNKSAYKIPVDDITRPGDQQKTSNSPNKWITLTDATHWLTSLVPNSSPPVVVGGEDYNDTPTSDIKMYDDSSKSWRKIGSLPSARTDVSVATVSNNAIIVVGGCAIGGGVAKGGSSCLTKVELGQAQLST